MTASISRRHLIAGAAAVGAAGALGARPARAANQKIRMSVVGSATDQRSVAMTEVFGPAVKGFGDAVPAFMLIPLPRPRPDKPTPTEAAPAATPETEAA